MPADLSLLDKIRALRALAAGNTNLHEAEAAAARAAALCEQYKIDEAVLLAAGEADPEKMALDPEPMVSFNRRTVYWSARLARVIAEHHGCAAYRHTYTHGRREIRICGRPSDVALARLFFAWLAAELPRLCDLECRGAGRSARASWLAGAVRGIDDQLRSAAAAVRQAAPQSAAMVVADRNVVAKATMHALVEGLKSVSWGGSISDSERYRAGRRRGEAMHLGAALPRAHKALPGAS